MTHWQRRFYEFDRLYFGRKLGRAGWRVITRVKRIEDGCDDDDLEWTVYSYAGQYGETRQVRVDEGTYATTIKTSRTIIVLARDLWPRVPNECDQTLLHEMAHAHLMLLDLDSAPENTSPDGVSAGHGSLFRAELQRLVDAGANFMQKELVAYTPRVEPGTHNQRP